MTNGRQFPSLRGRQLIRLLSREPLAYRVVRQTGSHRRLESDNGYAPLIFAFDNRVTISPGMVKKILTKDVGLSIEDALDLL